MATASPKCRRAFRVAGTSANAPFAVIPDESRKYYGLKFHPEVVHTPDGAKLICEFRAQHRRHHRRLDHARLPRGGDREDPQAGRQGQGDLRPLRRRRFLRRRRADPRGDRRPAHLHLRRSRPAAARRGRDRGRPVPRITTTSRWCMSMRRSCSSASSRASPIPNRSARSSAGSSSTCSTRKPRRSAAPISWPRARSIPT